MQLTIKTLSQETFKVDLDPSSTVLNLKEKLKEMKNYEVDCQKLMYQGKILKDENTLESYNVTEAGFIVVMVSQPKPAPPPAAATQVAQPTASPAATTSATAPVDSKPVEQTAKQSVTSNEESSAEKVPPPKRDSTETQPSTSPQEQSAGSAVFNESTFLTSGPVIEEAVENIKTMGFSEEMIRKALHFSYYNPDRAVELLITNDPLLSQPMPSPSTGQDRPREPTPGVGLAGGAPDSVAPTSRPNPNPLNPAQLPSNTLDYLSRTQQFQQIRNLIQSNPAFLEPLLVELQNTNPELFEQINENREEFFRLMTSSDSSEQNVEHAGGGGGGGGESDAASRGNRDSANVPGDVPPVEGAGPRVLTVTLTPEEQAKIDTIINWSGVSRQQAVEVFLLCDRNAELAINYIMDNENDL